ncbi:unnamed protein product [Cladocopium goreaui]|uniref:RRM domain-containing protein n=1 Tax=Cladocopium goreaui TaxID=2562237 RepID=A0A9P1BM85_9DINO|nr:unnamed protein product [Cladocopium goreaui]
MLALEARCLRFRNVPEGYTSSLMREELEDEGFGPDEVLYLLHDMQQHQTYVFAASARVAQQIVTNFDGRRLERLGPGELPDSGRSTQMGKSGLGGPDGPWWNEAPRPVSPLQRLTRLQLNDNPLVNELMEQYRPWILRLSPQVEELDNETVSEVDRRAALPPAMSMVGMVGMGRAVARRDAGSDAGSVPAEDQKV